VSQGSAGGIFAEGMCAAGTFGTSTRVGASLSIPAKVSPSGCCASHFVTELITRQQRGVRCVNFHSGEHRRTTEVRVRICNLLS
jgi:nitrate/nitrite transporter NarK